MLDIKASLATVPLFAGVDDDLLAAVARAARVVEMRARRTVLREGETADRSFVLVRGAVRVFHRADDGREVLVKLFRAPALFGEMEVLAGQAFLEHVVTLEPSALLILPASALRALLQDHGFAVALARDLAARLCIATKNERALAFCDVDARVANLLLDYAALAGTDDVNGVRIDIPLTQEGMANDLAVSRKSLGRALDVLRDLGIVDKSAGRYFIKDKKRLGERAKHTPGLVYRLG